MKKTIFLLSLVLAFQWTAAQEKIIDEVANWRFPTDAKRDSFAAVFEDYFGKPFPQREDGKPYIGAVLNAGSGNADYLHFLREDFNNETVEDFRTLYWIPKTKSDDFWRAIKPAFLDQDYQRSLEQQLAAPGVRKPVPDFTSGAQTIKSEPLIITNCDLPYSFDKKFAGTTNAYTASSLQLQLRMVDLSVPNEALVAERYASGYDASVFGRAINDNKVLTLNEFQELRKAKYALRVDRADPSTKTATQEYLVVLLKDEDCSLRSVQAPKVTTPKPKPEVKAEKKPAAPQIQQQVLQSKIDSLLLVLIARADAQDKTNEGLLKSQEEVLQRLDSLYKAYSSLAQAIISINGKVDELAKPDTTPPLPKKHNGFFIGAGVGLSTPSTLDGQLMNIGFEGSVGYLFLKGQLGISGYYRYFFYSSYQEYYSEERAEVPAELLRPGDLPPFMYFSNTEVEGKVHQVGGQLHLSPGKNQPVTLTFGAGKSFYKGLVRGIDENILDYGEYAANGYTSASYDKAIRHHDIPKEDARSDWHYTAGLSLDLNCLAKDRDMRNSVTMGLKFTVTDFQGWNDSEVYGTPGLYLQSVMFTITIQQADKARR